MVVTDRETVLEELDRLLDLGEPLLTLFPKREPDDWVLQLPGRISLEMGLYADCVAIRARFRRRSHDYRQPTIFLAERLAELEVGLLGWRAIGVLE